MAAIACLGKREEIPFRMQRAVGNQPLGNSLAIFQIVQRYDQLAVAIGRQIAEMEGETGNGIA